MKKSEKESGSKKERQNLVIFLTHTHTHTQINKTKIVSPPPTPHLAKENQSESECVCERERKSDAYNHKADQLLIDSTQTVYIYSMSLVDACSTDFLFDLITLDTIAVTSTNIVSMNEKILAAICIYFSLLVMPSWLYNISTDVHNVRIVNAYM